MNFVFDYLKKQLSFIALTAEEADNYKSINKIIYPVIIDKVTYNFRTEESKLAIDFFLKDFDNVFENYIVSNGIDSLKGHVIGQSISNTSLFSFIDVDVVQRSKVPVPAYKSIIDGNEVGKYSFYDLKSLNEITSISGYKIIPAYPKSSIGVWKSGGIVFAEFENGVEMIMSIFNYSLDDSVIKAPQCAMDLLTKKDLWTGTSNTDSIVKICNSYTPAHYCKLNSFNGFSDWFLPSYEELLLMKSNLYDLGIGKSSYFDSYGDRHRYRSCSISSSWGNNWYRFNFSYTGTNGINDYGANGWNCVRPVRIQK
jgi:hypothetical protein